MTSVHFLYGVHQNNYDTNGFGKKKQKRGNLLQTQQ